jgi:hypothetical protein
LLAVVGPFSSLHSKPYLLSTVIINTVFFSQSCGGAFFIDFIVGLHETKHTYWLALDVGCTRGLAMCVRFRSLLFHNDLQHAVFK